MSEFRPTHDDEIDLFEFFETLWDGKWLISVFVAIALLLGIGFMLQKDAVYESKVIYSVDTIPPFYEADKALADFHNKFYSVSVFEEWKKNNSDTSLVYEDFSKTEVVDGFVLSKDENKQLATLTSDKKVGSFILITSNQLPTLNNFFEYASYINGLLKNEYVVRTKEELKIIDARFNDTDSANSNIISTVLSIDRYIVTAEKGAKALTIQPPTMPKKVSPKSSLIIATSLMLGAVVGVFVILVRNAIANRKGKLAKA